MVVAKVGSPQGHAPPTLRPALGSVSSWCKVCEEARAGTTHTSYPLQHPPPRQGDFSPVLFRKSLFHHYPWPDLPVINAAVAPQKETRPSFPAAAKEQQLPPGSPVSQHL